ncbi:MAG: NAD-dependent epimerase/dehydratase family protein [Nannocystaceae bacterium]
MTMHTALVTGGFGFLGSWIVRTLRDEGVQVRVFAVPGEPRGNLDGVELESVIEGDIRDPEHARRAVDGCDTVFHAAAIYSDWAPDPTLMYDVNLRGTYNMLEASKRAGVARVIYTASIVSLGRPLPGRLADETTPYEAWSIDFPYSRSKFHSRELAEYFAAWGLDVRVVCPAIVLGPGDVRPTPSGQLLINVAGGAAPPAYYDGGGCYVDVRDAARVHVLAAQRGKAGERYLAAAHNLHNRDFVEAIAAVVGRRRRLFRLPEPVARGIARGYARRARKTGEPPLFSRDMFEYSLRPNFYDNRKARGELGATFRGIHETIADALEYFREVGKLAR